MVKCVPTNRHGIPSLIFTWYLAHGCGILSDMLIAAVCWTKWLVWSYECFQKRCPNIPSTCSLTFRDLLWILLSLAKTAPPVWKCRVVTAMIPTLASIDRSTDVLSLPSYSIYLPNWLNLPNSAVLSFQLWFFCSTKSKFKEVPLDDACSFCHRSPTP